MQVVHGAWRLVGVAGAVTALLGLAAVAAADDVTAAGVVFADANGNGVRDAGEAGVPDVRVSNGREIVPTDADGRYRLPVTNDTIIFVIKPAGWMTPTDAQHLPRFFYIHKPNGSPESKSPYPGVAPTGPLPESIDFPLRQQEEPARFDVLLFGDPQVGDTRDIQYLAHDIVEEVIGTTAAFGVSLGDLVYDHLDLLEPLCEVVGRVGIPWYNVLGNHDRNYHASADEYSDESFERVFGPAYYAFVHANVHFLVLDNPFSLDESKYRAGLGDRQLDFVENYLREVPREALVVVMAHIPFRELPDAERTRLFGLLRDRPNRLLCSAHYHVTGQEFHGDGADAIHEIIAPTTCGSWWTGVPDELGIPHTTMRDGAPNGWLVATFEGNRYIVRFRPARRPADYQMNIYAPEEVPAVPTGDTEVLANVFFGSSRSIVEMRVDDGEWVPLAPVERMDPSYAAMKKAEEAECPPPGKKLPKQTMPCPHMWRGVLPPTLGPGVHVIHVRTTDVFGQQYSGQRLLRVVPGVAESQAHR